MEPQREVSVTRPIQRKSADYVEFTGRTEPAMSLEIRPRITSTIKNVVVRPGAEVKKGDLLFELDSRPFVIPAMKSQAELRCAQSRISSAKAALDRVNSLMKQNVVSNEEVQQKNAELVGAEAEVAIAQAANDQVKLDFDATRIKSPAAGRIGQIRFDSGSDVDPKTVLATLVSVDPLFVVFDIDQNTFVRQRGRLQSPKPELPVLLKLQGEGGFDCRGHVDSVDNRFNPATGTIQVCAVFPNAKGEVVPGMFAKVRLITGEPTEGLWIPQASVSADQGRRFVNVVNAKSEIERRFIKTGRVEDDLVLVREGIGADDRVVVEVSTRPPPRRLEPGMSVKVRELPAT